MSVSGFEQRLSAVLRDKWGYRDFRPLQMEAARAVLSGRESLVVLPTGGGKSICFQAPALLMEGIALVVSPLISLMKDQVDALRRNGVMAECLHSGQSHDDQQMIMHVCEDGQAKLLYVSPERLMSDRFLSWLSRQKLSFVAIDEAHCISQWGHDFRPEYRDLRKLRGMFVDVAFHTYTATATEEVRRDIVKQLGLHEPEILVGSFDRPNLSYKVLMGGRMRDEVAAICERHKGESGIVYTISRKGAEGMAESLVKRGIKARPYHAGLSDEERRENQDAFIRDEVDVIAATVAFGMGIDKPDVRFVVHAGPPQSLEHYQQESGRAGRDGLPSECVLIWSARDFDLWDRILFDGVADARVPIIEQKLASVRQYCYATTCRRAALLQWFGEAYHAPNCGGCDICTGNARPVEDGLIMAQKILSCIVRLKESWGAAYVGLVLTGSRDKRILDRGHNELSTYGILANEPLATVRSWIDQLMVRGFLAVDPEVRTLRVRDEGWRVLRGEIVPNLLRPDESKAASRKKSRGKEVEGLDEEQISLFEYLRSLRREIAREENVPAYLVFGDRSLIDMAGKNPKNRVELLDVHGVGLRKLELYGARFLEGLREWRRSRKETGA